MKKKKTKLMNERGTSAMHGGTFIAFMRTLNSRISLHSRYSDFRCKFFVWLGFFAYSHAAKITGIVNVVHQSVSPQNIITVGDQIMQGNVNRFFSKKETSGLSWDTRRLGWHSTHSLTLLSYIKKYFIFSFHSSNVHKESKGGHTTHTPINPG